MLSGTFKDGCLYVERVQVANQMGADAMPSSMAPQEPMQVRQNIQPVPG